MSIKLSLTTKHVIRSGFTHKWKKHQYVVWEVHQISQKWQNSGLPFRLSPGKSSQSICWNVDAIEFYSTNKMRLRGSCTRWPRKLSSSPRAYTTNGTSCSIRMLTSSVFKMILSPRRSWKFHSQGCSTSIPFSGMIPKNQKFPARGNTRSHLVQLTESSFSSANQTRRDSCGFPPFTSLHKFKSWTLTTECQMSCARSTRALTKALNCEKAPKLHKTKVP